MRGASGAAWIGIENHDPSTQASQYRPGRHSRRHAIDACARRTPCWSRNRNAYGDAVTFVRIKRKKRVTATQGTPGARKTSPMGQECTPPATKKRAPGAQKTNAKQGTRQPREEWAPALRGARTKGPPKAPPATVPAAPLYWGADSAWLWSTLVRCPWGHLQHDFETGC